MIKFRKQHSRDTNTVNCILVKQSSRKYKKILDKAYSVYKDKLISKLRLMQSENPERILGKHNNKSPDTLLNRPFTHQDS